MVLKSPLFLITVLVLQFQFSILAEETDCPGSTMGKGKENFPDSISFDSVYKAIGRSPNLCGIAMKKWPHGKDAYVVYVEDTANYYVTVLTKNKDRFKVEYKHQKRHVAGFRFESFDFARYRITKNSTAIGIRFFTPQFCDHGTSERTNLLLLEIKGDALREVLWTPMSYRRYTNWGRSEDGLLYEREETASGILMIGKPDKSGYNKLTIKVTGEVNDNREGGSSEDVSGTEVFTWTDGGYSSAQDFFGGCED